MTQVLKDSGKNCTNCGAALVFSVKHNGLYCRNCKTVYDITPENKEIKRHTYDGRETVVSIKSWAEDDKVLKCSNCGASVVLNGYEYTKTCPYCKSPVTIESGLPGLKPDSIVLFRVSPDDAKQDFLNSIKKARFAPSKLKREVAKAELTGTYITSFVFDGDFVCDYKGVLSYTETVHVDGEVQTKTYYQPVKGRLDESVRGVGIETSSLITQMECDAVGPFNYSVSVPFRKDYFRGFVVEHYAEGLIESNHVFEAKVEEHIKGRILQKHGCDNIVSLKLNTTYARKEYTYTLLPMYFFEFKYGKKQYRSVMNGQTGQMLLKTPKSALKIALLVFFWLMFAATMVVLIYCGIKLENKLFFLGVIPAIIAISVASAIITRRS